MLQIGDLIVSGTMGATHQVTGTLMSAQEAF